MRFACAFCGVCHQPITRGTLIVCKAQHRQTSTSPNNHMKELHSCFKPSCAMASNECLKLYPSSLSSLVLFLNLLHHIQHTHGVGVRFVVKHQHKLKGQPSYQCALGNSVEHICLCADELIFDPCRYLKSVTVPNQAHASNCCTLVNRPFGCGGVS